MFPGSRHLLKLKRTVIFILIGVVFVVYFYSEYFLTQIYTTLKNITFNKTIVLFESEFVESNSSPSAGVLIDINYEYGLGNQLFYYAASYTLSRNLRIPLLLPLIEDSNEGDARNFSYRNFDLHRFSLPKVSYIHKQQKNKINNIYSASCEMAQNISLIPQEMLSNTKYFEMNYFCFHGKFFDEFEDELKEIRVNVRDPSAGYLKWRGEIGSWEWPVGVHVRRGDIRKEYWSVPIDYFKNAMGRMKKEAPLSLKLAYFVFSDEINWAREGLVGEGFFFVELGVPVYFVSGSFGGLTNLEELDLMIKCRSIVISNSTFSWWAAYLMKDGKNKKIVIRPKFNATRHRNETGWNGKESYEYAISYPEEWIPMEA